jgi:peptidyl-prolyl cis-trans isomerase B (cyclophilin B)
MPHSRRLALPAAVALLAAALALPVAAQEEERPAGPPSATPNPVALETPAGDGTGVRLTTDLGDIVIGLFNESAPVAAENFQNLVEAGFYDGVGFHRVVPGFVIQGGDPEGTGGGGPGYTIADEEVVGEYGRGIVAMARTPEPDSQGSQFFVVLDDEAKGSLDAARTYAIFGRVVEGMDVVDAIVARGPASDQIDDPVRIQSASIEQVELPPEPTPAPPSAAEVAADALAAQVPQVVAGIELVDRASFSSDAILAQVAPDILAELETLAEAHGTDLERLSIARAAGGDETSFVTLVASSIEGVEAADGLAALGRLVLGVGEDAVTTTETIAGREVTRIELAPDQVAYVLAGEDVVWFLVADEDNLEEVVAALP